MTEKSEVEQTHCVVQKVFAFSVPPLGSAEGFKASLWPKQPIWVGRLRVVSRNDKCAVLLEHTDKDGLFASCPIQNAQTVESAIDSSRYFVLRLSDGKGRHALIGIGFNDRAQAFDFKVALQDWQNHNQEGGTGAPASNLPESTSNYSIPQGGSIHVTFGGGGAKKKRDSSGPDVSVALAGMKLDAPPAKGASSAETEKEKKKKKKREKEAAAAAAAAAAEGSSAFGNFSAAQSVVGSSSGFAAAPAASSSSSSAAPSSNIIDFGFGDFDPLSSSSKPSSTLSVPQGEGPRRASVPMADPFAADAAPSFGATPFDTPFDDTPSDWVKF